MKDFKSYSDEHPQGSSQSAPTQNTEDINNTVELAKALSKAMNGKSERQLLSTIIAEAERGKREGTLSNTDLDNFYNALAPMLDGFKKRKLKEVITKLKSI